MTRNPRKPTVLDIGVISDATMRPEHLIPSFLDALEPLHLTQSERAQVRQIRARASAAAEIDRNDGIAVLSTAEYWDSEDCSWDLDALFDIGSNHTPDYCYFGSHPGDGACYGAFVCDDFQRMIEDDGGMIVNDTSEVPAGYVGHVLQVSDHGNATLYHASRHGKLTELWSIV